MKSPARIVVWMLPLLLSGCFFHKKPKPPVQQTAPSIAKVSNVPPPAQEPPPVVTIPTQPQVPDTKLPAQTPKPPARHKKPPPEPETPQAAATPEVSAIGQLSSGEPADVRHQTEVSIAESERALKAITRPLSDAEQKTVDHIREFLKQAKDALTSGDVDGASTLAAKAKLLLTELQK